MRYRNVYVLCTGRCGSTTFAEASHHLTNYTSAHESRAFTPGPTRLDYPEHHIEVDNRLSWFLGRLDQHAGDEAFYVHLKRDAEGTAQSYARRFWPGSIMNAYGIGIIPGRKLEASRLDLARDYVATITANIDAFLKDKTHQMTVELETAQQDYTEFWERISGEGDLDSALAEWGERHNEAGSYARRARRPVTAGRVARKLGRAVKGVPRYMREV